MRMGLTVGVTLAALAATGDATAEDAGAIPVGRVAMGPAFHMARDAGELVSYALDVSAGVSGAENFIHRGVVFNAEAGYTFDAHADELHAFHATVGFGLGAATAAVVYHPRFIIGTQGDDFAIGMRNGIGLHLALDIVSLEAAHQFVHYRMGLHHDVRVVAGINFAAVVYVITALAGALP